MTRTRIKVDEEQPPSPFKRVRQARFTAKKKLMSAAYDVLGRRGLEGSTITEIVQEAGVGVGSFYNHFSTKEDIAEAVFAARTEKLGRRLGRLAVTSNDTAVAACYVYRSLIDLTGREPIWGAFVTQMEPSLSLIDRHLRKYARPGIEKGVADGRLFVADVDIAITLFHSACIAAIRSYLNREISLKRAHAGATYPLRMLGVPLAEADDLATWPMGRLLKKLRQK